MTPDFRTLAWLLLALGCATIPMLERMPLWLPPVLLGAAIWRLYLAWHGHPAPARAVRLGGALGLLILLVITRSVGTGIDGAAPLFVTFVWMKLLELDRRRDLEVTVFCGFFMIAGGILTSQTLIQLLSALLAVALLLTTLVWHQSHHLRELPLLGGGRWAGRQVAVMLLQALPLGIILFLICPRPPATIPLPTTDARTGVSSILDPGRFARNLKDETVAFRVSFADGRNPSVDDLYWRGLVLWNTDGNQWRRGISSGLSQPMIQLTKPVDSLDREVEISLQRQDNAWLYTLDSPVSIIDDAQLCPGLVQQVRRGSVGSSTYRVLARPGARDLGFGPRVEEWSLQLPEALDPRILDLADSFSGAPPGGPVDANLTADRAIAWFAKSGFLYTTEPGVMAGPATATFLFDQRQGFCAHFASAFTVLMRAARVPARVVVGYHGGEPNPVGNFLTIRQSHAHAWAEVWTGEGDAGGWRRVDLTALVPTTDPVTGQPTTAATTATSPAARNAEKHGKPWYEQVYFRVQMSWEYLEYRWDIWGVGYSEEMQRDILTWLGLTRLGRWGWLVAMLGGIVLTAILGIAGTRTWRWWCQGRNQTPAQRWRQRYERCLDRLGFPAAPGEGPRDHARRAALALPRLAEAITAANDAWISLHYGPPRNPADVQSLGTAIRHLERQAKQPGDG